MLVLVLFCFYIGCFKSYVLVSFVVFANMVFVFFQVLTLLMDVGGDLESVDSGGWTPLHCACAAARASCVSVLTARGADPAAVTPDGHRPAALIGTVRLLLLLIIMYEIVLYIPQQAFYVYSTGMDMFFIVTLRFLCCARPSVPGTFFSFYFITSNFEFNS